MDDGVDGWEERVGVDMLRDPRLPVERLPPIRANASTVTNRNIAAEMQTTATANDRFFMVPPGSDAESVARYRGAPRASTCPEPGSPSIAIRKRTTQGAGRQIPRKRRAKDERRGPACSADIFPATARRHPPSEVIHKSPEGIRALNKVGFTSR